MTPLYKASEGGHLQVVKLLLSRGAEVDGRDEVSTYNNLMYSLSLYSQCVVLYMKCVLLEYYCFCDINSWRVCIECSTDN